MTTTNGVLYEAFGALVNVGQLRWPAAVAWRLAQNRIALRAAWEALEDAKRSMLGDLANTSPPHTREETAALNALEKDWLALLAQPVEWQPATTILRSAFEKVEIGSNDLAALVVAGLVVEG